MALQNYPLLSEATLDLILGQLRDRFNALLADVDNQYSDGINLEPIDSEHYFISYNFQTLRSPAIYVLLENHAFQYTNDPNYMDSNDRCIVVVTCEDVGSDALTRKAMRYGRVLYACLNQISLVTQDQRLKIHLIPETLDYTQPVSDKLQEQQKKFRMDVVLTLKVTHYEKFLT